MLLELFNLESKPANIAKEALKPTTQEEEVLMNILQSGPQTVDQISQKCKLDISIINSSLSLMELGGKIKQIEPLTYALNL